MSLVISGVTITVGEENRLLGRNIEFVVVNAYKSSHICSVCREEGFRNGKTFHCKRCGIYVDSDLNASRLIGKRKILRNLSISWYSAKYLCLVEGLQL